MRNTLKRYHSKESPIEDSTVRKYTTLWRKRRERDRIRRQGMLKAIRKGMEQLSGVELAKRLLLESEDAEE